MFASLTRKQRKRKVMRNRYAKAEKKKKSNLEQEVVILTHTDPSNYSV